MASRKHSSRQEEKLKKENLLNSVLVGKVFEDPAETKVNPLPDQEQFFGGVKALALLVSSIAGAVVLFSQMLSHISVFSQYALGISLGLYVFELALRKRGGRVVLERKLLIARVLRRKK